jgi:uncharacterized nucleotidyltransferase DUF6036
MPLDKARLFEFLEEVDSALQRKVVLVAAGGTAMTLLDAKESTIDVDFTGPSDDIAAFQQALKETPHGFKFDTWPDGQVFSQFLPDDYLEKSKAVKRFKHIELRALNPVDVVVTKTGRLDERDLQDIEACVAKFSLMKRAVAARAKQVTYVGNEENYRHNVDVVLKWFFGRKSQKFR